MAGLFNRGRAAEAFMWQGRRASAVYLGSILLWDGTTDTFVTPRRIVANASLLAGIVTASAHTVAPKLTATAMLTSPSVSAASSARPETAIIVTALMFAPTTAATARADILRMDLLAIMFTPTVSESFDRTVPVPPIHLLAQMSTPNPTADFASAASAITVTAVIPEPVVTATGTVGVNAPAIAVSAVAFAPAINAGSTIRPATIAATATVAPPTLRVDSTATVPVISASATVLPPNIQAVNFQNSGLTKSGVYTTTSGNTWSKVTGWTPNPAGTVIESDGIRVPVGVIVNYLISVAFASDTGPSTSQGARLVNGSTVVNDTETSWTGYGNNSMSKSGTLTGTGELVVVEARASSTGARGQVKEAGTSLTLTRA